MRLNPVSGNMYDDVDLTHNIIRGRCRFDCIYCFMKKGSRKKIKAYQLPFHYDPKELKGHYPCGKRIFVGSATDMWIAPPNFIEKVLRKLCCESARCDGNLQFVFQSKDPAAMAEWIDLLPKHSTLITTLETNRNEGYSDISNAPVPGLRALQMLYLSNIVRQIRSTIRLSVTVEPILDFDEAEFSKILSYINPDYVSIGAATLREYEELHLPRPSWKKVVDFVSELTKLQIPVRIKKNLLRLAPDKRKKGWMLEGLKDPGVTMKFLEDSDVQVD